MTTAEIPLLRESVAYTARLARAARARGESSYATHRRINWSHRYSDQFYAAEAAAFVRDSDGYLADRLSDVQQLEDVFAKQLTARAIASIAVKIAVHRLFALLGKLQLVGYDEARATTYRKCYVDDIELVFDPNAPDALRWIYPYPLSIRRQFRYLRRMRREGRKFRFAGHPYLLRDFLSLLRRRDLHSLMRMETRAQLAHAREIARHGYTKAEMSDEFNLGSLEFARALDRLGIDTVNSAHGVGKYLPVHAYRRFITLTKIQQRYYIGILPCEYELKNLNDVSPATLPALTASESAAVRLILLSQTFPGLTGIVREQECRIIERLAYEFSADPMVDLLFKSHPTQGDRAPPAGFRKLAALADVNGRPGTVFISQFSTCQIDPTFKGHKVLVRGPLVHPEIAFDADQPILTIDELVASIRSMAQVGSFKPLERRAEA